MKNEKVFFKRFTKEQNPMVSTDRFGLFTPCSCGCDYRGTSASFRKKYFGYATITNKAGVLTVWLTKKEFEGLAKTV